MLLEKEKLKVALVGNPNSGKTSLFNQLTGLNQKIGNYPGVTVDKKSGTMVLPNGKKAEVLDLRVLTPFILARMMKGWFSMCSTA